MKRNKIICPDCGQEISKSNFSKHQRRHQDHPETFLPATYSLTHEGLDCQFCGKTCKNRNSLCNHERLCKQNPDKQVIYRPGFNDFGRTAWNKGLTKETSASVRQTAESNSLRYKKFGGTFKGKHHSEETRDKLALKAAGNTRGNRSKKGYYKGWFCGSCRR